MVVLATMNVASAADPVQVVLRIEDGELAMTSTDGSVIRCAQMTLSNGKSPIELKGVDGMIQIKAGEVTLRAAELHLGEKNQRPVPATRHGA
jgi:hypothetical protein